MKPLTQSLGLVLLSVIACLACVRWFHMTFQHFSQIFQITGLSVAAILMATAASILHRGRRKE